MNPTDAIQQLIERFEKGADLLTYAAKGLSPEQIHARPGPGAWSIAELCAHLADSDMVGADRMKRVIAEPPEPRLWAYDEVAWIARLDSDNMPVDESLHLFALNRRSMARVLRQCDAADFARAGIHTERGRETLAQLVADYVTHLDHHLRFLYGKRAALGVALNPHYSTD